MKSAVVHSCSATSRGHRRTKEGKKEKKYMTKKDKQYIRSLFHHIIDQIIIIKGFTSVNTFFFFFSLVNNQFQNILFGKEMFRSMTLWWHDR
jgi:hypothetical protein